MESVRPALQGALRETLGRVAGVKRGVAGKQGASGSDALKNYAIVKNLSSLPAGRQAALRAVFKAFD